MGALSKRMRPTRPHMWWCFTRETRSRLAMCEVGHTSVCNDQRLLARRHKPSQSRNSLPRRAPVRIRQFLYGHPHQSPKARPAIDLTRHESPAGAAVEDVRTAGELAAEYVEVETGKIEMI